MSSVVHAESKTEIYACVFVMVGRRSIFSMHLSESERKCGSKSLTFNDQ